MIAPPLPLNARLRYDVVRRLLPPGRLSILEVGCGQGAVGARLAAAGHDYLGLEPDPVSYRTAATRLAAVGRGEVRNLPAEDLGEGGSVDLVCAFEVLEHIDNDVAALRSWISRVRPGGWVMVSTPAFQSRFAAADEMAGHYRRYDPEQMRSLFERVGLTEVRVVVYGMPLGYPLEWARNLIGRRRRSALHGRDLAERTSGSGRLLQPKSTAVGIGFAVASWPFQLIQRGFPTRGTGLVARGRRPPAGSVGAGADDQVGQQGE